MHGKPKHTHSQGSVEYVSQDLDNILSTWLETCKTDGWSEELKFIQLVKNRAYHEGITCSSYEAMFGIPPRVGLEFLHSP